MIRWAAFLLATALAAQTTQGLITGTISDALTNKPLPQAQVTLESPPTNLKLATQTGPAGTYTFPQLSPGTYRLTVTKPAYQTRAIHTLELTVAGYINVNFSLRPLDALWERFVANTVILPNQSALSFLGPDLDPAYTGAFDPEPAQTGQLEPSLSAVMDPALIKTIPLTGRDVYTALAYMPGVTADTATGRSLGLSSNGQRPTSANFLLDGLEDNNHFVGGPSLSVPPEAIQEYRISTSSFSAEYGRTSGQIANAVTARGGNQWHGLAYTNLRNDILNANSYQSNAKAIPRTPLRQLQTGLTAGGPLLRNRLYQFTALEYFRSRSFADPAPYALPSEPFIASLPPGSIAAGLFQAHPEPGVTDNLRATIGFNRRTALTRLDYQPTANHRVLVRLFAQDLDRPDFVWTPYGNAPLRGATMGAGITLASSWTPRTTTELRAAAQRDTLRWNNPLPDVPILQILGQPTFLPGASTGFGFNDHSTSFELSANIVQAVNRNLLKAGAGLLARGTRFALSRKPQYLFADESSFRADSPFLLIAPLSRLAAQDGRNALPNGGGNFHYTQAFAFLQEAFRLTPRLTVNAGLRLDSFGSPKSQSDTPTFAVTLGPGSAFPDQVQTAAAGPASHAPVFSSDTLNWAARFGFAWSPRANSRTTLRGAYGMFYDRWFDNIWSSAAFNDLGKGSASFNGPRNYLAPLPTVYAQLPPLTTNSFYNLTAFAKTLRTPLVHSYFLGLQQVVHQNWNLEAAALGSLGRRLITNDIVNRQDPATDYARPNLAINEDINLRANQGYSDYAAMQLSAQYRRRQTAVRASYTWSHSIDNQSDPLLGDFFDIGFANQTDRTFASHYYAGFSRQYDRESDRGNADFDQRHNLLIAAWWNSPAGRSLLTRNWTLSGLYALRSGLPYTVFLGGNCVPICNVRPDLVSVPALLNTPHPVPGGQLILDKAAFTEPPANQNGNLGRNSLRGSPFQNLDLSLARAFSLTRLRETARLTLRADFYNVLNHANYNNPQAFLNAPDFGVALKGRVARAGFPALTPLNETARQIEILLRLEF